MFRNAREVFEVAGFKIRIDPSWFIIAALIVWSLFTVYFPQSLPDVGKGVLFTISLIAMIGLFVSLILHELAHSWVARQFNLNVGSITLFIFGGVAELERDPQSAKSEFWIAIAGPAMSFALGGGFLLVAGLLDGAGQKGVVYEVVRYLGNINLVLAIFNLVPAFPLDGGRVLRSILWHIKKDVLAATRTASRVGTMFGFVLVALGILAFFSGQLVVGLWQLLIGMFIIGASRSSYEDLAIRQTLKNYTVSALMTRNPRVVDAGDTVNAIVNNVMLKHNVSFVPVLDGDQLLGYVDAAMIQTIDQENWGQTTAGDIFTAADSTNTVSANEKTEDVFDKMAKTGNRKLLIASNHRLEGVISLADLMHFLSVRSGLGLPPGRSAPAKNKHSLHA